MPKLRIGVGGSAANPPHLGHKILIETLLDSELFDKIIWILSGARPDKDGFVLPAHRKKMTELTFAGLGKNNKVDFIIRYDDIGNHNTPTVVWFERLKKEYPGAEITWYTGVDSVVSRKEFGGKCEIEAEWEEGEKLMRDYKFLILPRQGYPHPAELGLPENFSILDRPGTDISSTEIRNSVANGDFKYKKMVTPGVASYIETNKLYK